MQKYLISILFVTIFISACEKADVIIVDNNYPTTIYKINDEELSQLQEVYLQRNEYIQSTIDQFGFCGGHVSRIIDPPDFTGPLTKLEAESIFHNFVLKNLHNLGMSTLPEFSYELSYSYDENWRFRTVNQRIDSIEVLRTPISVIIEYGEIKRCFGNWYPEIYIPQEFNYSLEKAKSRLVNKVAYNCGFVLCEKIRITTEMLAESSAEIKIYPLQTDDKIELRVVWEIHIMSIWQYNHSVDVMTGEIFET